MTTTTLIFFLLLFVSLLPLVVVIAILKFEVKESGSKVGIEWALLGLTRNNALLSKPNSKRQGWLEYLSLGGLDQQLGLAATPAQDHGGLLTGPCNTRPGFAKVHGTGLDNLLAHLLSISQTIRRMA